MFSNLLFYNLVYPAVLLLCAYLGKRYASMVLQKKKKWKPLGVENGIMGIYALAISFALIISGNRHRERTATIHEEADDLALLFRKSKLYEPQLQQAVKNYLLDFYQIQLGNRYPSPEECSSIIDSVEKLDQEFDEFLVQYAAQHPESGEKLNELTVIIERLGSKYFMLLYSFSERFPGPIRSILIIYSCLLGALLGYMEKMQQNRIHITLLLFIVISFITINTINDMNSPAIGLIRPDYTDILDIKALTEAYYTQPVG